MAYSTEPLRPPLPRVLPRSGRPALDGSARGRRRRHRRPPPRPARLLRGRLPLRRLLVGPRLPQAQVQLEGGGGHGQDSRGLLLGRSRGE